MDKITGGNRPLIGVTPLFDDEKDSIWMLPGYMDGVRAAGGLPIILPLTEDKEDIRQIVDMIDGLLLTGGHDVAPALYGEMPTEQCGTPNKARDSLEYALLDALLKVKPVFGICRGIQVLNAYLGGTLYQDIPSQLGGQVCHDVKPQDGGRAHVVSIVEGTPLCDILHKTELSVNSYHHQGVKLLAQSLKPMARAEDGLVEAAYMPGRRFVIAVQWHPELSFSEGDQMRLFRAFVNAC